MDKFRALKGDLGAATFRRCSLTSDEIMSIRNRAASGITCAFLFKVGELEALAAASNGMIVDRGQKLAAKPLAYYLARRTGLVRIRANYRDPGQAERGIRALLSSPAVQPKGAVFLIGLKDDLFEQLWNRANEVESQTNTRRVLASMHDTDQLRTLLDQNPRLKVPEALKQKFIGSSAEAEGVRKRILLAAGVKHPVLIEGETGTGKEVVARMIHQFGDRSAETFVAVNCGGIPSDLLESELFGHVKGAFTGALRDKNGLWTLADAGTLFLDEIGDLSPLHQVKVLRALEDGRYRAVGGEQEIKSGARIIAATNRDLRQMVETGRFRDDLFYRLFTLRIRTPALREHPADIPELAAHFWHRLAENGSQPLHGEVLEELKTYAWPGNARELRSFLTTLFVLADGIPVTLSTFRAVLRDHLGPVLTSRVDR
jgi:transcriptional regulator with GAF, ATPase, and Fis domain